MAMVIAMFAILTAYFFIAKTTGASLIPFDSSATIDVSIERALLEMIFSPEDSDTYGIRIHDTVITWSANPTLSGVRFKCVKLVQTPGKSTSPGNATCRNDGNVETVKYEAIPAYPTAGALPSVGVVPPENGKDVCGLNITSQVWSVNLYHRAFLAVWCNGQMSFFVNLAILPSKISVQDALPVAFLGRGWYRYVWTKFWVDKTLLKEDVANLNLHFDKDVIVDLELMSFRFFESALLPQAGLKPFFVINNMFILDNLSLLKVKINQTRIKRSAFTIKFSVHHTQPRWDKEYDEVIRDENFCPQCHQIIFGIKVTTETVTATCSCGVEIIPTGRVVTLASFTLPQSTLHTNSNFTSFTIQKLGAVNPSVLGRLKRTPCTSVDTTTSNNNLGSYRLLSAGKPVRASSQSKHGSARSTVDGNASGRTYALLGMLCSQELHRKSVQWLEINLLEEMIVHVVIITQVDPEFNCALYEERALAGGRVLVGNALCGSVPSSGYLRKEITIPCAMPLTGSKVKFRSGSRNSITLCEIQVYGKEAEKPSSIEISPRGVFDKLIGEDLNQTFGFRLNRNYNWQFTDIRVTVEKNGTLEPKRVMECCDGNQMDYKGVLNVTYKGRVCSSWNAHGKAENHNYCRNPDGKEKGVWCYVNDIGDTWEYCALSRCSCSTTDSIGTGSLPNTSAWGTPCYEKGGPTTCQTDIPPPSHQAHTNQDKGWHGDWRLFHATKDLQTRSPPWCMVNNTHWEFCNGGSRCTNDKVVFAFPQLSAEGYSAEGVPTRLQDIRILLTERNLTGSLLFNVTLHHNDKSQPYTIPIVVSDPLSDFQPQRFVSMGTPPCILYVRKRDTMTQAFLFDHEDVVLCPDYGHAFTRKFFSDYCHFSIRCPGDKHNFQACGCTQVKAPQLGHQSFSMETMICRPLFMRESKDDVYHFSPIQTSLLCDGINDCSSKVPGTTISLDEGCYINSDEANGKDTDDKSFSCYEGDPISVSHVCNGKPDCTDTYTLSPAGEKQYFYEDELACPKPNDIICKRLVGLKLVTILVPPRYQCDEMILCKNSRQENKHCVEVGRCKVTQDDGTVKEKSLYAPYLCDRTHQYCDNWKKTMYNCTNLNQDRIPTLRCNRKGREIWIITRMECDGEQDCDDGADEECLIISAACKINIRHLTQPVEILAEIYKSIEGCIGVENLDAAQSSVGSILPQMFANFTGVEYVPCPRQPGKYILIMQICDHIDTCVSSNPHPIFTSEEAACLVHKFTQAPVTLSSPSYHSFMQGCLPGMFKEGTCTDISKDMGYITAPALRVEVNRSYECSRVSGRAYALLKCNGMCRGKASCPFKPISAECNSVIGHEASSLTKVPGGNNVSLAYHSNRGDEFRGKFSCSYSTQCVDIDQICDHRNDCVDLSDEGGAVCDNKFSCKDKTRSYIPLSMKCDGSFECQSRVDECNEECWKRILDEPWMRVGAFIIGVTATLINSFSIAVFLKKLGKSASLSSITNDCTVALISLGDLIVGVYMLMLFVTDVITQRSYCPGRYQWLGSWECNMFGVMSTFGTILSLLAMTFLSLFRIISLKTMMIFSDVSTANILKLVGVLVFVVGWSVVLAVIPVVGYFEDYFVNGLYFEHNPLYVDVITRDIFNATLKTWNASYGNRTEGQSWSFWRNATVGVFGVSNNRTTKSIPIGFYGNDGVCLFKYFVKMDDPQWHFSMFVLVQNLVCFGIITACYTLIILHTATSSEVRNDSNPAMARLQRKVTIIIATDFTTWIPFITIALVHFIEVADMTPFYSFCSIILLPINSVLNPLIYNSDVVTDRLRKIIRKPGRAVRSLSTTLGLPRSGTSPTGPSGRDDGDQVKQ